MRARTQEATLLVRGLLEQKVQKADCCILLKNQKQPNPIALVGLTACDKSEERMCSRESGHGLLLAPVMRDWTLGSSSYHGMQGCLHMDFGEEKRKEMMGRSEGTRGDLLAVMERRENLYRYIHTLYVPMKGSTTTTTRPNQCESNQWHTLHILKLNPKAAGLASEAWDWLFHSSIEALQARR